MTIVITLNSLRLRETNTIEATG
jgi:hypothetical protein